MTHTYHFKTIEEKWRPYWEAIELYKTGEEPHKPSTYILDYFPYPSGDGLSVGHCRNYVPTCIDSRYKRMNGYNVLHPMGWDAFGLPAENIAIKQHIHPRESSRRFSANYKRQMQLMECSYDRSREFSSTDPDYYRWTQYFFLLLFQRGLAYEALGSQWWCPRCQTILANEQVEQGKCWRCESDVTRKEMMQWYFKITAYADRLIADLDIINWPERIKTMQRNWIGRSDGAEVTFDIQTTGGSISTFTTRPDTLFGVTFIAIAPEHPLATQIVKDEQRTAVTEYIQSTGRMTEIERQTAENAKSGVFTGSYAIHPLTGAPIPIWVADYVLIGYGRGAVMGVPAHDRRDHAFAQTFGLSIVPVISPDGQTNDPNICFTEQGILLNSGKYNGLTSETAMAAMTTDLNTAGHGYPQVTYKLRDWLISRQRYWGAPIPIIHCPACGPVAVPEEDLPVELPETQDFAPTGDGRSPLARIESWVQTPCPQCGTEARRETDTMDGFACSSWYFLRFASPHEATRPFDPTAVARWLPVDTYVGGAEHAVMHLLYARFWTKVMYDAGLISFIEPFAELKNQGMLLSAVNGQKMSKSKGNVVTPDEVVAQYGTDALRLYVVFLGPFDAEVTWDDAGIRGMTRFLERYWRLANGEFNAKTQSSLDNNELFERKRHKMIRRVTEDMERYRYNTAVAALMSYLNELIEAGARPVDVETFTILLAPFAPFITEEVWQTILGHTESVHRQSWPVYDVAMTTEAQISLAVQVNGKLRDHVTVSAEMSEAEIQEMVLVSPVVQRFVDGRAVRNIVLVPHKLVNVVV